MTKKVLSDSMRTFTNHAEFITRGELARFMGIRSPRHVDKYLAGLECVNGKYYLISDVSARMMSIVEVK